MIRYEIGGSYEMPLARPLSAFGIMAGNELKKEMYIDNNTRKSPTHFPYRAFESFCDNPYVQKAMAGLYKENPDSDEWIFRVMLYSGEADDFLVPPDTIENPGAYSVMNCSVLSPNRRMRMLVGDENIFCYLPELEEKRGYRAKPGDTQKFNLEKGTDTWCEQEELLGYEMAHTIYIMNREKGREEQILFEMRFGQKSLREVKSFAGKLIFALCAREPERVHI